MHSLGTLEAMNTQRMSIDYMKEARVSIVNGVSRKARKITTGQKTSSATQTTRKVEQEVIHATEISL